MKKILLLTLALLMVLACTPIVMAEDVDDITFDYQVMSDGTIRLDKYTGVATNVKIPETYDGYKVTWIIDGAFASNKTIESVHIPKNITFIAEAVFADCDNLTEISADNSVYASTGTILYRKDNNRIIGYACGSKTSVLTIPSNTRTIAPCSFKGADYLKTVITNNGLKEIGYDAFMDCKSLEEIYVVDDNTFIDGYLFGGVSDKVELFYNGKVEMQAGKVPCKISPYILGMENPSQPTTSEKVTETTTKKVTTTKPVVTEKETIIDDVTESTAEATLTTTELESTTLEETVTNESDGKESTETIGAIDEENKNKSTPIIVGVIVFVVAGAVATGVTVTLKKKKK